MEYPKPIMTCDPNGTIYYQASYFYHRLDGPAIIYYWGDKNWMIFERHHRFNGDPGLQAPHGVFRSEINKIHDKRAHYLNVETTKLGSINQFIDFVARTDILLIL